MLKKNIFLLVIISLLFSICITVIIMKKHSRKKRELTKLIDVVMTKRNIMKFSTINSNNIMIKKIPMRFAQPNIYTDYRLFFTNQKSRFFTKINILSNTQITRSMVQPIEDASLELSIPHNMRAVNVEIQNRDFFNLLMPGATIDFIINLYDKTLFLIQNVLIIKKGVVTLKNIRKIKNFKNITPANILYDSITVLLSNEDVLKYYYMVHNIETDVVARSKLDNKIIKGKIIKKRNLLNEDFIPYQGIKSISDINKFKKLKIKEEQESIDKGELLMKMYGPIFKDKNLQKKIKQQMKKYKK